MAIEVKLGLGREVPWGLRKLARQLGKTPEAVVAEAIQGNQTLDDAAASLNVTPETLRSWRRRLEIDVV